MRTHPLLAAIVLCMLTCGCQGQADCAIDRGVRWLQAQQQADGSWRSGSHGVFRDGSALTPHVLRTLIAAGGDAAAIARGKKFLESCHPDRLAYPTYAAADAWWIFRDQAWIDLLRARQLGDPESFPSVGGWAYPAGPLDAAVEANLSATAYAVCALAAAGASPKDPALAAARSFVLRCRNEDGGFLFGATATADNKAGGGISYGSTTADGLRAMLACGLGRDDPAVAGALKWLTDRFDPAAVPGDFIEARSPMRNANYFYYLDALTDGFVRAGVKRRNWSGAIAGELIRRQSPNGSWRNELSAGREDEPIVSTTFAIRALLRAR